MKPRVAIACQSEVWGQVYFLGIRYSIQKRSRSGVDHLISPGVNK